ncbi:MAG TPA: ParA family protein [Caulobacteraceae bacterium]|nr:ParA family protein [Caulobacteraceae bacterium]
MRTISVIARKGGSGKSTVAVQIALAAHLRGRRTLIADADPQHSAGTALEVRQGLGPEVALTSGPELYQLQWEAVRSGVDAMVIDTPAVVGEEILNAVVLADFCLLVVRPTYFDLAAAAQTLHIVRPLKKPVMALLNQAPAVRNGVEPAAVNKALRALAAMRLLVVPATIRARAIYQQAMERGLSAEETDDAAAAQEVADLWSYVERLAFPPRVRHA